MPNTPEYNSWSTSGSRTYLYGAEYESGNNGLFTQSVNDQNVPCARCLTPRSAVMMYPARRNCPSGWIKEYEGTPVCIPTLHSVHLQYAAKFPYYNRYLILSAWLHVSFLFKGFISKDIISGNQLTPYCHEISMIKIHNTSFFTMF